MADYFKVKSEVEGIRLDVFLSEKLDLSRSKIKNMIEAGCVFVNNKKAKASLKVKKDMIIEGTIPHESPLIFEPQTIPLEILYEDEYLLFVNKPAGLVVHPSFGHKEGTLMNALMAYLKIPPIIGEIEKIRPGIVHRLDKDTTGVILLAKNSVAQKKLAEMFSERKIKKVYRAIVYGTLDKEEGTINERIGRHPKNRKKMAVLKEGGREAKTDYKVISRLRGFTYLEVYPHTGRTHQIRVHFSHIGHPIVGDSTYGKKAKNFAERPLLHALSLEFTHPFTNKHIIVCAPEPEDMKNFIRMHT